jgi:hypothetical protein
MRRSIAPNQVFSEHLPYLQILTFVSYTIPEKSVDSSRFYSGIKCIDNMDKTFSDTKPTRR